MSQPIRWSNFSTLAASAPHRMRPLVFGLVDQGLSVGAMFLVNVALARTQTKEQYGMFALSYSIFTFLAGLHNAAVLEPFTVYASGRYRDRFAVYWRVMMRSNLLAGLTLSAGLLLACLLFLWVAPSLNSPALFGLAVTVSFILSGSFLRRSFYVVRQPGLAARTSLVFFIIVASLLWLAAKTHELNGFTVFLILALGWVISGLAYLHKLPFGKLQSRFLGSEPRYWGEHWAYSRWVLATAFVFQFMHQGYYWLLAGFLSVKEVGELKAMYVLIAPVEQVTISLSFLFLPALAARYVAQNMDAFLAFWKRYALLVSVLTLMFAIGVRVVGSRVIHLLYAGRFDGLAPLLYLLALVPLVMGIGNTMSEAIRAAEKPRLVFYAYLSSALATFVIGIPLVKFFGLRGAAWGMIVSAATYSLALFAAFYLHVYRAGQCLNTYASVMPSRPIEEQLEEQLSHSMESQSSDAATIV
jgi:O-antigen/teichoic acid export membrane protein